MSPSPASPSSTAAGAAASPPPRWRRSPAAPAATSATARSAALTLEGDALAEFRPEEIERDRGASLRAAGLPLLARERARFRQRRGADPLARAPAGAARGARRARGDRPRRAEALAGDPERPRPRRLARSRRPAVGGLRPARFPQDRARASCPAGGAALRPSERGRRPHPAGLVCRAGRPARQCPGRYRHAGRPHRRGQDLGLYRPPRRLAGRSGGDGRADDARSRKSCPTRSTSG